MRVRRLALALFGALIIAIAVTNVASAGAPRSGSGLFIADDEWDFNDPNYSIPALGEDFAKLNPKAFRLQTIWNTMDRPEWKARTHAMIDRARGVGVTQIILTLRSNNPANVGPEGYFPTAAQYRAKVEPLVVEFASKVDVWGPANEPNGKWRPDNAPGGSASLSSATAARYYDEMRGAVAQHDSSALVTSPDFLDDANTLQGFEDYVTAYSQVHAGGWGDAVAFHAYRDVEQAQLTYTNKLASLIPVGKDIWVTEVGAQAGGGLSFQNSRTSWIANTLANHPRVKKVAYYSMHGSGGAGWDTGLTNPDFTRRLSWYTWCAAAHGDNAGHYDCRPRVAPTVQTDAPSGVRQTEATLNGTVNPDGFNTTYRFEYGLTAAYGSSAPVPAGSAGAGGSPVGRSVAISGLQPGATYHYRMVATSAGGTSVGADRTFTTLPGIFFSDATNIGSTTYWARYAGTGWQQSFLFGHRIAAGTTPVTLTSDGLPRVYFVDADRGNRLTAWGWTPTSGWQQEFLSSDPVAAGSSPAAINVGGVPHVFYSNANNLNSISYLARPGGVWQQTHLFGHAVSAGSSPSAVVLNGEPRVFFSDAHNNDSMTMWGWTPSLGWQLSPRAAT